MSWLLVFVIAITGAEALGKETCSEATRKDSCVTSLAANDHSLLQVHPASTVAATKKHGPSGSEPVTKASTELQQEQSGRGQHDERKQKEDMGEDSGNGAANDPYPEDNDLDTDYPRDDKGTHADTIREVQSASLPGDGDIGKNTKPGLRDSWNVDTMFVTDSDGGGHVSLRDMIPWGYRSQTQAKDGHTDNVKDKSGLLSEQKSAREETNQGTVHDENMTNAQPYKNTNASRHEASTLGRGTASKSRHGHASSQKGPTKTEAKK